MPTSAERLSRQAGELARRARDIQAGHIAETRRATAIWTVLSQPALRTADAPSPVSAPAVPPAAADNEAPARKRKKKAKKAAKKARKKAEKAEKKTRKAARGK